MFRVTEFKKEVFTMLTITEWLNNLSENYSVQHFDDIKSGIFCERIKGDIYLMKHAEVKE